MIGSNGYIENMANLLENIDKSKVSISRIQGFQTELDNKQDKLETGSGIDITNNVISVDDTVALKSEIPVIEAFTATEVQTIWNGVS